MLRIRGRWRELPMAEQPAVGIDHGRIVGVLVGVDSTNDRDIVDEGCHAGNAPSVLDERTDEGEPTGRARGL
jgi:hypothetical protein